MQTAPRFPAKKLFRYPHMFPLDITIWERFIELHGDNFLGFDYDVKVGSGTKPTANVTDEYRWMQAILSKYRIDVVGYDKNRVYIIEVKPEAGTIALGQIEAYTKLYIRDLKPSLPVKGVIVTDRELPDMAYLCTLKNIELYVV